ncbi:cobalamin biosynthesis protein [Streptomyces sp. B1866]|uniref:cobalamin biosynthesis protein n=1 Tax=Streptomyces sp. B1866 TaxID=3075431 RepID=UPI00288CE16D|nr:cobalamin biosynthesis protein [Streptomyces sp. B1866]MDT3400031.1 cobalamin biosynthesis protein [Streptomyces sp. B1866]
MVTPAGSARTAEAAPAARTARAARTGPGGPLVVGVGACRGVAGDEVVDLVCAALAEAGLSPAGVVALATAAARAAEPGLVRAAARLGVPLRGYGAGALAAVPVPHPSALALAALGTPSVAEAAALLAAGEGGVLLVGKRKSRGSPARATCAVACPAARPRDAPPSP